MRIVLIGPPGVGKGTQSQRLVAHLKVPHISTGEMLRDAIRQQNEVGKASKKFLEQGQLVPDPIILQLVERRLQQDDCADGFLFDGFPRTLGQAEAMDRLLDEQGTRLDAVLELAADRDQVVKQLSLRGREDDTPDIIGGRLDDFTRQTAPLIQYYERRGMLQSIDGSGTPVEVFDRIKSALQQVKT